MTLFPRSLLNSDDDWIESVRERLYPALHPHLKRLGGYVGVPMFGTSDVNKKQFVGSLGESEETIEEELEALSSVRNPIAAYKTHPDGRQSEGSWVLLHEDYPDLVEEGMQLHLTLFQRQDLERGRDVFAHYEDSWRTSPVAHLRASNFHAKVGANKAREFFDNTTFLSLEL